MYLLNHPLDKPHIARAELAGEQQTGCHQPIEIGAAPFDQFAIVPADHALTIVIFALGNVSV